MRKMLCFCDLPEELMVEIFSWLSPESLISLKCVCKSFNSILVTLIKDPTFVSKHLQNANNNKKSTSIFLNWVFDEEKVKSPALLTVFKDKEDINEVRYVVDEFDLPFNVSRRELSHCNGLICFFSYYNGQLQNCGNYGDIILWNPAIREFKFLPKPRFYSEFNVKVVGFGYDSKTNNYKVIRIVLSYDYDNASKAELYSLATDSWREIKLDKTFDGMQRHSGEIYCKGVIYSWVTKGYEELIMAFDMEDEEFSSIPVPHDIMKTSDYYRKLTVWNESVALFVSCLLFECERLNGESLFEIWVLDDKVVGARKSCPWNKCLTIGPIYYLDKPLVFVSNDNLIIETPDMELQHWDEEQYNYTWSTKLVYYNIQAQKLTDLPLFGLKAHHTLAIPIVKSLVSVK